MKLAVVILALLSTLSLRVNAQMIFANDKDNTTRVMASNTSSRGLPPVAINTLAAGEAPAAPVISVTLVKVKPEPAHRFIDRTNSLAFAALAGSLTADALSTQRGLAFPRFSEMNPIARPFVQTRVGAAFYTAGSFAFLSGGMYLAHKTNHHRLEKITPFVISGWEAFLAARNYHLVSRAMNSH